MSQYTRKDPPWSHVSAASAGLNQTFIQQNQSLLGAQPGVVGTPTTVYGQSMVSSDGLTGATTSYSTPQQTMQQRQNIAIQQQQAAAQNAAAAAGSQGGITPQLTFNNRTTKATQGGQRVFTGTVTKLNDTFGFVDEDVFFQTNTPKGSMPKIGEHVLVEATHNASMPFTCKWNATRIQLLNSPMEQQVAQAPPPQQQQHHATMKMQQLKQSQQPLLKTPQGGNMIPTHNQQPPTPGLLGNPPPLLRQPLQGVVQQPSLLQGNTQAMQNLAADKNEDNIDEDKDIEIVASTDMDVGQKGISSEPEERSSSPESQLRGLSSELMLRMGPVPPHGPSKRTWLRKLRRVRKKFNTSGTKSSKQSVQSPQTKSNDSRFSKSLKARHTNPIPLGHTRAEATSNGKIKHIKQDQHKLGAIPNKRPSQSIRPSSSDSHSTKRFKTVPLDSKTRSRAELINGGKTEHKKQPQDKHGSMSNKKPPQSSQNTSGDSHSKKRSTAKRLDSVNKTQGRSDPKYFGETVRRNQGQDRDGAISNKKPPQSSQSMSGDSHSTKRSTAERLDSVHKTQGRPDPKYFGETIHRNQGQDRDGAISNKKSPQFSQSMSGDSHLTKRSTAERSVSIPITWAETEATGSSQIGISLSKTVGPSKQSSLTDKVMGIHQISEDSFEENIQIETSRLPVIPHAYSSSPSSTTTSSKLLPTPIEGKDNTWFTSLKKGLETPTQLSSSFKGHKPITTSHLPFMSGFDSHFHPDMIGWFSGKRPTPTIDPEHSIQLVGGILNFSDPEYYKDLNFMEKVLDELPEKGTWRFAVGVHPKFASEFTEEHFDSMMCHINHPLVMGVSEIGLDFTVPPERWPDQEALLIRVLSVGLCGMVLILHLRGTTEDLEGRAVHNMARCLLQKHCHKMQRMHLQSFSSDMSQVQSWIRSFPHCYFGITGLAQYFTPEQEEAVKAIPQDRLLLETDSPHFAPHPELDANYPAFLGDVGAIVAGLREIPLPTLMSLTLTNARRLYVSR